MFGPEAAIYALAAVGLNLHFGYTGLLNFGQVAFMLVGAYGVAVVGRDLRLAALGRGPRRASRAPSSSRSSSASRPCGCAATTSPSPPSRPARCSGTSSVELPRAGDRRGVRAAAVRRRVLRRQPVPARAATGSGRITFDARSLWVMVVGWSLVALACILVALLIHSPWGRVLRSVREDELAARSLGKNVYGFKIQSLVLGGVLGALAGALLAINVQSVQPDSYNPVVTFYLYTIVILGGASRILGPGPRVGDLLVPRHLPRRVPPPGDVERAHPARASSTAETSARSGSRSSGSP